MKKLLIILVAALSCMTIKAQSHIVTVDPMYCYGVCFSPVDSTIYITDMLMLKGAQINKKTKFLVGRNELSAQFKRHMEALGIRNLTSCIMFNKNLNKLDKAYKKQVAKYEKQGFTVRQVDQTKFRYEVLRYGEE